MKESDLEWKLIPDEAGIYNEGDIVWLNEKYDILRVSFLEGDTRRVQFCPLNVDPISSMLETFSSFDGIADALGIKEIP